MWTVVIFVSQHRQHRGTGHRHRRFRRLRPYPRSPWASAQTERAGQVPGKCPASPRESQTNRGYFPGKCRALAGEEHGKIGQVQGSRRDRRTHWRVANGNLALNCARCPRQQPRSGGKIPKSKGEFRQLTPRFRNFAPRFRDFALGRGGLNAPMAIPGTRQDTAL